MQVVWIILGVVIVLALMIVLISYLCFRMAFYSPDRPAIPSDAIDIPEGAAYEEFREDMEKWARDLRAMPHEEMSITSFDGLKLYAKYYEYAPGAPIELMFHGYRGSAERDLCGGVQRCFALKRSALIVDQRSCGDSKGNVITFGIKEHRDCLDWVDFMVSHFGPNVRIILTGISMGAATVLTASGKPLPPNVIGILADCGYSSARQIICKVVKDMGIPAWLGYPFVKLGARLFGHFDLEETSPLQGVKQCSVPVIFYHGEADTLVPCSMSRENFEACGGRKRLVTVPGAGHGLSYAVEPERYLQELRDFFGPEGSYPEE